MPERPVNDDVTMLDPDLQTALMQLTERQRELVVLRYVVDMTPEEIAAVLDTNRAAVYAALGRAQRRLEKLLTTVEPGGAAASLPVEARGRS